MQKQTMKKVSGIALGSSMLFLSMLPAASAMATTMPAVTAVKLTSTVASTASAQAGSNVTFTASATQSGSGTPEYQFWVDSPNGTWKDVTPGGWTTNNSYTLSNVQNGSYEVVVFAHDKGQTTPVNSEQSSSNQFVNVGSTFSYTTNASDVAPLQPVTITAKSTNLNNPVYQYWLGTPNGNGGYSWSALNVNGSNGNYSSATTATFTPPSSGNYQIAVYAKDLNAPSNNAPSSLSQASVEHVYGSAAAVKLSAQSSSLVADGTATDTITAAVQDSNGNTVANYTGQVEIPPVTGLTFTNMQGSPLSIDGTTGNYKVPVSNGVGQFQISAATSLANSTGTLTSEDLSNVGTASISYGSTSTLTFQQLSASSIGLSAASAYLSDNSSSNTDVLTATINDQANQPLASGSGSSVYVTFTINGNATFADGSKTYSEYVTPNGSTGTTIPISAIQGQGGTISVSASATGLKSPTPVQIQAVQTSAPSTFSLTSNAETTSSGTPYSLYTVQLLDASGIPVAPASGSPDALTISDNTATVGGTLEYYPVVNGTPTFTTAYTASTLPSADLRASNNGQFQFAVENSTVGSSNPTISVTDALTGTTKTAAYSFAAGAPARALLPGDSLSALTAGTYNVEAGQTATFKINLTDAAGNPVTTSGQAVDVYFSGAANGATINGSSNWTNSNPFVVDSQNGVATVSVAVPSGATSGFTLAANVVGHITTSTTAASVVMAGSYTTQLGLGSSAGTVNLNDSLPTSMSAGQTLLDAVTASNSGSLYAVPLNAVGASTGTNDSLTITSSNGNVLQIGSGSSSSVTQGSGTALPTITAMHAGTATLTITDTSDNAMPVLKETISVASGAATQLQAMNPNGTTNQAYTFASSGVVGPFTIQTTDAGGNVAPVNAPVGLTANQVETILGVSGVNGIRTSASGSDVSTVTIPQNQASLQVWVDGATASTSTSPTTSNLNTEGPALVSASGSGSTVNLTFDGAVTSPTLSDITLSGGQTISSHSTNGDTLTLNLSSSLAVGETVSLATGAVQSGYGAPSLAASAQTISGTPSSTGVVASGTNTTTGTAGTDATVTVNNIVYSSSAVGTADNSDTVTISQGSGTSTASSATFASGALAVTIGTNSSGGTLATDNSALLTQVQTALAGLSGTPFTAALASGASGTGTATVAGTGTFAGGTASVDGIYTLTVSSGATATGNLSVTVMSGATKVGTATVAVTAGETATAVATAIYTALNALPYTTDFTVANPSNGVVTLTQVTASSATTSVTVSG